MKGRHEGRADTSRAPEQAERAAVYLDLKPPSALGAYASLRTGVDGILASGIRLSVPVEEEEIYSLRFDFDLGRRTATHHL